MVAPGPQSRWSGWLLFVDGMTAVVHCVAATYPNTGSPKKKRISYSWFSHHQQSKNHHILPQPASRKGQWTPVVLWTTGLPGLHASPPEKGHHGSAWDVLFTNGVFYQKYDYETTKQHKQPLSGFSQDVLFFIYFSWRFPGLCHPWIFNATCLACAVAMPSDMWSV